MSDTGRTINDVLREVSAEAEQGFSERRRTAFRHLFIWLVAMLVFVGLGLWQMATVGGDLAWLLICTGALCFARSERWYGYIRAHVEPLTLKDGAKAWLRWR